MRKGSSSLPLLFCWCRLEGLRVRLHHPNRMRAFSPTCDCTQDVVMATSLDGCQWRLDKLMVEKSLIGYWWWWLHATSRCWGHMPLNTSFWETTEERAGCLHGPPLTSQRRRCWLFWEAQCETVWWISHLIWHSSSWPLCVRNGPIGGSMSTTPNIPIRAHPDYNRFPSCPLFLFLLPGLLLLSRSQGCLAFL